MNGSNPPEGRNAPESPPISESPPPGTMRQKRIGALLTHHAGGCLGSAVGLSTREDIQARYMNGELGQITGGGPYNWPAGHATDDTDMTRAVLLVYRNLRPGIDVAWLAGDHFLWWLHGRWTGRTPGLPRRAMANSTAVGLLHFETRRPYEGRLSNHMTDNGSLGRCLPTGLFQRDTRKRERESMHISCVTHDGQWCMVACAAYNTIVAALVNGAPAEEAVYAGWTCASRLERTRHRGPVQVAMLGYRLILTDMAREGPMMRYLPGLCRDDALETLSLAVTATLDRRPLPDVLIDVVRVGMDAATNAAVAGGLLGAFRGDDAVPPEWRNKLQFADEFEAIVLNMT